MKSNAITRIVIYSIVTVLLIGILCACLGLGMLTINLGVGSGTYVDGEGSVNASDIQNLEIDWASGMIKIVTADTDTITFSESGATEESYRMTYEISGKTLYLSYGKTSTIQIGFVSIPNKDLTITVPKNWGCNTLEIDGASLDINVTGLTVEKFDLDGASNELKFNGSVEKLDCDGASNGITLVCTTRPKQIDIDGASCDLELTLPKNCGFRAELEGLSCDLNTNLPYSTKDGQKVYGDGYCKINVDGVSCDVTIEESIECAHVWDTGTQSGTEIRYTCTLCGESNSLTNEQQRHGFIWMNSFTSELLEDQISEQGYFAGDKIIFKTEKFMDVDLELWCDDVFVCKQTEVGDHWEFYFTMPDHSVSIQMKTSGGLLPSQEDLYMAAVSVLAEGKQAEAAIAFGKLGDYMDARARSFAIWNEIRANTTIHTHGALLIGIRSDGSVITHSHLENPHPQIEDWTDMRSIASGIGHIIGLKADGTVVAAGDNTYGQCDIENWKDIVAIDCGFHFTAGLKADGTIVLAGTVPYGIDAAQDWTDIVMLEADGENLVGLRCDGTAVALGNENYDLCQVPDWADIIDIYLDSRRAAYLRSDGSIQIFGERLYIEDQNIPGLVTVETDGIYLAGMMQNGTMYFDGYGADISDQGNIVAIVDYAVRKLGLRSDGTVIELFRYSESMAQTPKWSDIMVP